MPKNTQYKKLLETELATVEAELKTVGRHNPSNPNDWEPVPAKLDTDTAEDMEIAENITAYEENTAILKPLEIRYNDLKRALDRIKQDAYGACETCGKPIEEGRLEANPAATTCMADLQK